MVQGYYTLDEAAHILGIATEELSHMAQRREVRAFADRGTWRFRTQDIEELARRRGQGSNPDLPLGEAPRPQPHDTPTARSSPEPTDQGVFPFGLGTDTEQIDLGASPGPLSGAKSSARSSSKGTGPRSPTQKPGSDSDVRLVPDGSNVAFAVNKDSDIKLVDDSETASPSAKKKASGPKADSGVKLVPMDAGPQSPVRLTPHEDDDSAVLGGPPSRTSADSDVRLEAPSDRPGRKSGTGRERGPEDSFLTEEIDLDAEMKKAGEASGPKKPQPRPASSPAFELSEADLAVPKGETPSSTGQTADSSSDFDISLPGTDEMEVGSKESQRRKEEEISLGDLPTSGVTGESGINLGRPTDSGISLEPEGASSDEIELELRQRAASAGPATPPRPMEPAKASPDSSSDFELTLEDSGRLAPLDEERPAAAAKGDKDKDIFETDFEVPALEDESGSQAMALDESDTDLESSDFDLALDEGDMAGEEESGSQVVALDDEDEVDEGAATVTRTRQRGAALSEEETGEYAGEELEEEVAPSRRAAAVAGAPASWGLFAPIVLLFSFFVLFLVGLMSFELVRGMWGYHQSTRVASPVVRVISGLFYDAKDLPTD